MLLLRNSFDTPEGNLAFDEALVETADRCAIEPAYPCHEVLRLWEMPRCCVVLGRASRWGEEVNEAACLRDSVPILRRVSGGATIVAGPGCLMYSVLVSYEKRPAWRMLDVAHAQVMSRIQLAVQNTLTGLLRNQVVDLQGTCDLTLNDRKFSGNALRCKRHWMLYHGTIMLTMPLPWISTYLLEPLRQPEYRNKRPHELFLTNLNETAGMHESSSLQPALERQLAIVWDAQVGEIEPDWERELSLEMGRLLNARYMRPEWHRNR
jgi:lipoate---protein ligase